MFLLPFLQDWSCLYWHQWRYDGDQNIWKVREVCQGLSEIPKRANRLEAKTVCEAEVS